MHARRFAYLRRPVAGSAASVRVNPVKPMAATPNANNNSHRFSVNGLGKLVFIIVFILS